MLTRVQFFNFRGFRHLDARVGPVTAFLGPNSAGKTTALHAVRLACQLLHEGITSTPSARVENDEDGLPWVVVTRDGLVSGATLLPLSDWRALFVDQEVGEGVRFSITLFFEPSDPLQVLQVSVSCARNEQLKLEVRVQCQEAIDAVKDLPPRSSLRGPRLSAIVSRLAPEAVFVPPFYGTVLNEEYRARTVIDRLLGSGDQSHVVRNLVASLEPDEFSRLNRFLQQAMGATLTYRTTGDALQSESPLKVKFQDSNGSIEISAAGAGLVNLVALFCALTRLRRTAAEKPVIFLLDEPEAHLHPRLQADSTARLGSLVVEEFGAQLLLATHSVDILNRLALDGAVLLRVDRTAAPSAVVMDDHAQLFADLRTWVDLTPYTAIHFLASRRVLFCEGDGDRDALTLFARLKFRHDPARLRRFQAWTMARLNGAANHALAPLLTRLIRNEAVQTQARSGGFQVITVLDRDHIRTPGTRSDMQDGVEETTVVWSQYSIESLLLTPEALRAWVVAWIATWKARRSERAAYDPPDLSSVIVAALADADAHTELNTSALEHLAAAMAMGDLFDDNGRKLGGEKKVIYAFRRASERVSAEPQVWQRGKDRAALVLGRVREALSQPGPSQFPTDILRLLADTDLDMLGDPRAAIPAEIGALLERMLRAP